MPVYEYRCKTCENQFEALRPMWQADAPTPCPSCRGQETMRLLSVFAAPARGAASAADACATSAAMGSACCRTFAPGGG